MGNIVQVRSVSQLLTFIFPLSDECVLRPEGYLTGTPASPRRGLALPHSTPSHLHIVPIAHDATDGLALSSRNTYLNPTKRQFAPALYAALQDAARAWAVVASK